MLHLTAKYKREELLSYILGKVKEHLDKQQLAKDEVQRRLKEWVSVQTNDLESALYMAVESGVFVAMKFNRKTSPYS